ncbi:acyltransferase family protein [Corynebacterium aquatimens]|uniref:Peptidoglycan/LPS O-acetylase OafA/YrhL/lysophospholipase L1-like esterase n=1 Tax=Corynebacterium aquatimens TaxID=1190508 RepID=A0A931GSB2_9CORY|nr:acyltransferase family protein [Corynebacterium aquatimens]MBG6121872.1 peptidoglycan/LPS O-acetylase OafA/YrhL/lysophospholipase L1-like esterase [Corynebacterium aquatimens]WJY65590.1 O-acetyltransferase OatA [Corynebacterium aquatimens]
MATSVIPVGPRHRRGLIPRVPGLDGIRGLAVAAVVIYHLFPPTVFGLTLPGGYLGVDIFFVLSGFLITSLLVRERVSGGAISLKHFWLKRARRILPAAITVLVICTALAWVIRGDATVGLPRQFFTTAFFVNNWGQIFAAQSYFSTPELFAHYWSLAVEEQFYVLWPLIIIGLTAWLGVDKLHRLAAICMAGAVGSFLWMITVYKPIEDPTRVYYGTDTHAFGLLTGAALAVWLVRVRNENIIWSRRPSIAGYPSRAAVPELLALIGLIGLMLFMSDTAAVTYRGGLFLASILTAVVIRGVIKGNRYLNPIFENQVLRHLGDISFSLYLWHWPAFVFTVELFNNLGWGDAHLFAGLLSLALSLAFAELTFTYIEEPFRRRGYKKTLGPIFGPRADASTRIPSMITASIVALATVAALIFAPTQTKLERELTEKQEQQRQAQEEAKARAIEEARRQAEREEKAKEELVGTNIVAIGDSVMLASSEALSERFPGIYVDGEVSRHYTVVPRLLDEFEAQGLLRKYVVLGFGTNGQSDGAGDTELMDNILRRIGPDRVIVLVTPYGNREWMPPAQQEIFEKAREYPNVYVADWCNAAGVDPTLLGEDGIHPGPAGQRLYAEKIDEALKQSIGGDKYIPERCGP